MKATDIEEPKDGQTKYSMDYMSMGTLGEETAPAPLAAVNREGGGGVLRMVQLANASKATHSG